ncbi:MAG: methyltransferase domain-containing protein [Candidatus Omnitrophota bacterium]
MHQEESIWINQTLKEVDMAFIKEALDVGSSTKQFRTQIQPYIDKYVFKLLRDNGISIRYLDKKDTEGVDYVCDIENITAAKLDKQFDLVICCSLLEHVKNPEKVCALLVDLVSDGGYLLVSVPKVYRYHPDPIDTMFRPTLEELIGMFHGIRIIKKDTINIKDKNKYKRDRVTELVRYLLSPFNWKIHCLLMEKNRK